MKIAFLAPEFVPILGGVGVYTVELVKELSRRDDLEIHVITPRRGDDFDPKKIEKIFDNKIKVHPVSHAKDTFIYNFKFQTRLFFDFKKIHEKEKFDLIHSANLVNMPDIWLKFRNLGIPSIVTVHTMIKGQVIGIMRYSKNPMKMAHSEKLSFLLYPAIRMLEKIYLKKSNHIISISKYYEKSVRHERPEADITVIPNGIDVNRFKNIKKGKLTERLKKESNGKKVLLYVGRLITQKGIDMFLRLARDFDIHLAIAGNGSDEVYNRLIKKWDVKKERVTFFGFVPNDKLPEVFLASDCFILPSYNENFPISILEAMAARCPTIAPDVGAVREIIDEGKSGYIFRVGDYEELKKKVKIVLEEDTTSVTKKAYGKVRDDLSMDSVARQTLAFYKKVLKNEKNTLPKSS